MSEEGSAWSDFFDERDGLLKVRVAGVGLAAQGVKDEDVEALKEREAFAGDAGHVS